MNIQQILDFPLTVRLVALLGRVVPPRIGYLIGDALGAWAAGRRESQLARAVRVNQSVVRGIAGKHELDLAVRDTLKQNARDLYTLYHYLYGPEELQHKIVIDDTIHKILHRPRFDRRGLIISGLHLSIFDFVLQHIFRQGFEALVLTLPDPRGGRGVEFEMRKENGVNILPASLHALRQAVEYLQHGGMVITGIDHPMRDPTYSPRFFGHAAALPTHHIWLALQTQVPIVVTSVIQSADGNYRLMGSQPIEMEEYTDRADAIVCNAERVLRRAAAFIRMAPEQWNVSMPVWPELLDVVAG